MKKVASILFCVCFGFAATAQNTIVNDKNAEVRHVSDFKGVKISSGIDLYITQGSTEGVAVSASDTKYRDNIKTEVEDGILKIYYDAGVGVHINWGWGDRKMKAYVTVKDISELQASGGSDVYVQGVLQSANLNLHLTGGSDFHGQVDAGTFVVRQSGGSDVKISGKAASLSVDASGGSDFIGYDLAADNCDIDASGGSDVYITVNKEMNVKASGGSDVSYKGSGVIRNYSTSGSSDVHKRS
ncbi:MAG TPA: head GIN domain-containing protein [Chitinophagaceae bacterium]|nr:head GIN domain-containing protein [Chitinophagaceae bacterium]